MLQGPTITTGYDQDGQGRTSQNVRTTVLFAQTTDFSTGMPKIVSSPWKIRQDSSAVRLAGNQVPQYDISPTHKRISAKELESGDLEFFSVPGSKQGVASDAQPDKSNEQEQVNLEAVHSTAGEKAVTTDFLSEISDDPESPSKGRQCIKRQFVNRRSVQRAKERGQAEKVELQACKRKVGRPILFPGNLDNTDLTEMEKRCIKRRIANRENARRVKDRRQGEVEDTLVKLESIAEENSQLQQTLARSVAEHDTLAKNVEVWQRKVETSTFIHHRMLEEARALRDQLQLQMSDLEVDLEELDSGAAVCLSVASEAHTMEPMHQEDDFFFAQPTCPSQPYDAVSFAQKAEDSNIGGLALFPSQNLYSFSSMDLENCLEEPETIVIT